MRLWPCNFHLPPLLKRNFPAKTLLEFFLWEANSERLYNKTCLSKVCKESNEVHECRKISRKTPMTEPWLSNVATLSKGNATTWIYKAMTFSDCFWKLFISLVGFYWFTIFENDKTYQDDYSCFYTEPSKRFGLPETTGVVLVINVKTVYWKIWCLSNTWFQ